MSFERTAARRPSNGSSPITSSAPALLQRKCTCDTSSGPGGECAEYQKKRLSLQRKPAGPGARSTAPSIVHEVLRSPGQPLDGATLDFMESRFGHDFSRVRVHTGDRATESAKAVDAVAYTFGSDIVFAAGRYAPGRDEGRRILGHELTHVVQQQRSGMQTEPFEVGDARDAAEIEANRVAEAVIFATGRVLGGIADSPPSIRRTDGASIVTPSPPAEAKPKCGPDATDWFVRQVNTAMLDHEVLAVQEDLATANRLAKLHGTTASSVTEGGGAAAVLAQLAWLSSQKAKSPKLKPPALNPKITEQLVEGARSGSAATAALTPASSFDPRLITTPLIGLNIVSAALKWKALVDHTARYDFKAHSDSMKHPNGVCPDKGCRPGEVGIITLCPGLLSENCYESDLPGNLFYALIGRHVGWSELTLQLGSQLAELTDEPRKGRPAITWDTPDDTAAITLGFSLPLPLTRAALCGELSTARMSLALRKGCQDCLVPTSSIIR
jgi:Domain of unknown function (DUF4157)/Bacterial toxin 44